jgi:hypothetical protein
MPVKGGSSELVEDTEGNIAQPEIDDAGAPITEPTGEEDAEGAA